MTFEELQKANAQIKTTNISGKAYAPVAERITAFRRLYPDGFIETTVELLDENTCMAREPRPMRGAVTKPVTPTSPPRPSTGMRLLANSRPSAA